MRRSARLGAVVLAAALAAGCVERRYVVYSDPPGALVYRNGVYLGATPVDDYYVYYGKYEFVLVKDGYETLRVLQDIPAPVYEWPGLDFLSENVNPFKIRDVRSFSYTLQPLQAVRPEELRHRADELRARGQSIGAPREPRPAPAGPPPLAAPVPAPPPGAPAAPPPPVADAPGSPRPGGVNAP
jgi:hypothetical protein